MCQLLHFHCFMPIIWACPRPSQRPGRGRSVRGFRPPAALLPSNPSPPFGDSATSIPHAGLPNPSTWATHKEQNLTLVYNYLLIPTFYSSLCASAEKQAWAPSKSGRWRPQAAVGRWPGPSESAGAISYHSSGREGEGGCSWASCVA